jgi:hypothetical protein
MLIDLWHIHRDVLLRVAGVVLLIGSAALIAAQGPGAESGYELGKTIGTIFRNAVLGLVAGATVIYLVDRFYWRDDSASWTTLTPGAVALGGVAALLLAVAAGPPKSEAQKAVDRLVGQAEECSENPSRVVDALPSGSRQLPRSDVERLAWVAPNAPPEALEVRAMTDMYLIGRAGPPLVLTVIPAGTQPGIDHLADYEAAMGGLGLTVERDLIASRQAVVATNRQVRETTVAVIDGCHFVAVTGPNRWHAGGALEQLVG